jgi:vault protein inter-alpha-trypsin-like protein/flagellar hook capping protein FlgD
MKNNLIHFTFLFLVLFSTNLFSYDWLWIEDPQMPWRDGQGTIEEAIISVKLRGIYMEYGLYLTFSARGLGFTNSDTLEVQFDFNLPEEAIVHDSWLWVGDDIIRAQILDKWTAAAIYDTIVNRRQDPSILFKRGQGRYELNIFPMAGDESRKVKITYLAPTQWNSNKIISALPTNLLQTSKYDISNFHLLTWLDEQWENPEIIEFPNIPFQSLSDSVFGNYHRADIPTSSLQSSLNFAVDAPLNNGIYLNKFEGTNENFYQLAFLPSEALNVTSSYKVAVLIDYDASNSNITKNEILNTTKSQLHANLAATDSFNLILSRLNIYRASENWIPADSLSIENTFANITQDTLANYSNMPTLLANGIDFIKNNGNDGSILLISNSDQVGDFQSANQLMDDILNLMNPVLPIHIADFQTLNYSYNWIGGRSYRGNEYFYTNISRLTSANYYRMLWTGYSFSDILSNCFQSLSGFISSFDLYTTLQSGFCYGRMYLDPLGFTTYLNRPILHIGKYNGSLPFIIQASGVYQSQPFSQQFTIQDNEISATDSLSEEMWIGNYISSLEAQTQTNNIISEIINNSISERVISLYTAFLCLDPERGGEICYDCLDETQLVAINDLTDAQNDSLLQANPNPFNNQTSIIFSTTQKIEKDDITFKIYNILGQAVRTFKPSLTADQKSVHFVWDGTNDNNVQVSSGNYYFIAQTPQKQYKLKIMLLK